MIDAGDYIGGALFLVALVALCGAAAWLAVARALPGAEPAPRAVAGGVMFTLAFVGAHVAPLALGVLSRGSVLVAAALALLVAWRVPRAAPARPRPTSPATDRISGALAALAIAVAAVAAAGAALHHAAEPSTGLDMVNFHLPDVASWIRSGTLWDVYQFVPRLTHGNYPNNGDMVLLGATLPWRNDFAARLSMLPWLGLAAVAVYALGRELAAPAGAAALTAAAVTALPIVAESAVEVGLPDTVMWATFASGLVFAVRHVRNGRRADLVLGGLALGLSFGTKWYAIYAVAIAVAAWAGMRLARGTGVRRTVTQTAGLAGLVAAAGGIWLVRNWAESGNPGFPVRVAPFGLEIFEAPRDLMRELVGFTIAGYLDDPRVWSEHLLPTYRDFLGPPALALALAGLAGAVLAVRALRRAADGDGRGGPVTVLGLTAVALLCAVGYALTPYSAQGSDGFPAFAGPNTRYLVPALLAAAGPAAWLVGRAGAGWWGRGLHALVALAVLDGVRRAYAVLDDEPLGGLAVVAGVALAGLGASRLARRPRRTRAVAAGAAAVLAATGLALAGWQAQRDFNDDRYAGVDVTFDHVLRHAPAGHRIALAGDWSHGVAPVFPMFGPRLRNHVAYNGRWVGGMLQYRAGRASFLEGLRGGGYDLLVVGRGFEAAPGRPPAGETREERWAREARLPLLARSDTLSLYAVRG